MKSFFAAACVICLVFSTTAFAGITEDEGVFSRLTLCKHIYERREAMPHVYDDDKKQVNEALFAVEKELIRKYSNKDVAKIMLSASFDIEKIKPIGGDYRNGVITCRKYVDASQSEFLSKGKFLK
jgi:hypothetical protein